MKYLIILIVSLLSLSTFAQTGIGTTTPDPSAKLDVTSTNKGFLPPRVALTATNSASPITNPANGLMVFNTVTAGTNPYQVVPGYYYWDGTGLKWVSISTTVGNVQNQAIFRSTSNTSANGTAVSTWNSRFNNVAAGDLTVTNGTTFALSNGIYKLEWALPYQQSNTYNFMTLQEYISSTWGAFLSDNGFASIGNGGGSDWGGGTFAADIVDCSSSTRTFRFVNADGAGRTLYYGATVIITKLNSSITTSTTADNLGNHTATLNIKLNGNYLSNDGGNEGISIDNSGKVAIGTTTMASTLTVGKADGTVSGEITSNPQGTTNEGGQLTIKKSLSGGTNDWTIDHYATSNADSRFRIFNGATETNGLTILESGNFGLGTSNPTAKLNIAGGGVRIATGFGNTSTRPALSNSTVGNYEIRAVGGSTQNNATDDGFLRLSAGGGTNTTGQSSIDISGYSTVNEMNNNIVIRTGGSERLRIDGSGNFGLGTSSPAVPLHIENGNLLGSGNPSSSTLPSIYVYNNNSSNSTANASINVRTNGTNSGNPFYSLDVNGKFGYTMGLDNANTQFVINSSWDFNNTAANKQLILNRTGQNRFIVSNSSGLYTGDWPSGWGGGFTTYDMSVAGIYYNVLQARSDRRLKEKIISISKSDFDKLLLLNPVNYYWRDKKVETHLQYGFIAQEVESIFPELVSTASDSLQTKSVNYQALHALSLKAIQILNEKIELLDSQNKIQQEELELLKIEMQQIKKKKLFKKLIKQ